MPSVYLESLLHNKLAAKAASEQISVDQLVSDILSSVDLDRNYASPQSFQFLYHDLVHKVDQYVRDVQNGNQKDEFLLRDVAEWGNQSSYENGTVTPNAKRAALGRTFFNNVNNGKIPNVVVATTINKYGKMVKKLDKHGVVIYKVITN